MQRIRLRIIIAQQHPNYTQVLPRRVDCSIVCARTSQRKWTQRANVIIEKDESHLLLSPIGLITNRAFNCDGQTDGQTYKCIVASDERLVALH